MWPYLWLVSIISTISFLIIQSLFYALWPPTQRVEESVLVATAVPERTPLNIVVSAGSYFLSVLLIAKNESMVIAEWLAHYKQQGVDHIYLIDNGSTDDMCAQIEPFGAFVTVYHWPEAHQQVAYYNKAYETIKNETQWLLVVDADEYVFGIRAFACCLKMHDVCDCCRV